MKLNLNFKKIDLSGVKQFLFDKGERIGLVACGALAVLLVSIGVLKALSPSRAPDGSPYDEALKKLAKGVETKLAQNVEGEDDGSKKVKTINIDWGLVSPYFEWTALYMGGDRPDNKRRNPTIFSIADNLIQVDYIRGGYLCYEVDWSNKKVWAFQGGGGGANKLNVPGVGNPVGAGAGGQQGQGNQNLAVILKPRRFVVVTGLFPMQAQLQEFRRALKFNTLSELRASDSMPVPRGLEVSRVEIKPDGTALPEVKLYRFDTTTGEVEVAHQAIKSFFREALIDQGNITRLGPYLRRGLATPLPQIRNASYPTLDPKFQTDGGIKLEADEEKGEDMKPPAAADPGKKVNVPLGPAGKKENAPEAAVADVAGDFILWKNVQDKSVKEKLLGNFFVFDPRLQGDEKGDKKDAVKQPGAVGNLGQVGKDKEKAAEPEANALIRFIDVDVEPGKKYEYHVAVWMANPNYNKSSEVAYQALAEIKDLPSPAVRTPAITIPEEYQFYVADQKPIKAIQGGADSAVAKPDQTAVQVHRWVERSGLGTEIDTTIADWAIAERQLVRRGEYIGRNEPIFVEVPVWNKSRNAFEIGFLPQAVKKTAGKAVTGLPVNFVPRKGQPLVVDFEGGKRAKPAHPVQDESAVEVLVLTPEGKLMVRNSRIDSDTEYPDGNERITRYNAWVGRIRQLATGGAPGGGGGPKMPLGEKK